MYLTSHDVFSAGEQARMHTAALVQSLHSSLSALVPPPPATKAGGPLLPGLAEAVSLSQVMAELGP